MFKECFYCKKQFKCRDSYELKHRRFCSHSCYSKSLIGYIPKSPPPHKPKQFKECPTCKKSFQKKHSSVIYCSSKCAGIGYAKKFPRQFPRIKICPVCNKEFKALNYGNKIFCSSKCYTGKNHHSWRGGIKKENDKRKSYDCIQWRNKIFERDKYTCRKCRQKSVHLHPHHIRNYSQWPKLRSIVNNGITFCRECHKEFHHIYGKKNNNNKQIKEFL